MTDKELYVIDPVVYVTPNGNTIQPVGGIFKKIKKALKKVGKAIKKVAKPLIGVVASVALPGIGGVLVNTAMTAADVAKAKKEQKKVKEAAKKAAAADAAAIKQITDSFNNLKKESDAFRAQRGLPPLNVKLPDLKTATPEMVEKAFTTLQDDAAALVARESATTVTSTSGQAIDPSGKKSNTVLIVAGVAVAGLAVAYLATRKRR
jgi:hypothetical protein